MKAIVYTGPGQPVFQEVADPEILDESDAIVRVDVTTICGTDLHILRGDVPEAQPGLILGHEAVGTVEQVGSAVRTVGQGDKVLVSCISSCGWCRMCREGHFGQCRGGGGWLLGHTYPGTQAEYARVPFADMSVYRLASGIPDEEALMLSDTVPTGYEVGVLKGRVQPGDVVAIVGAGPVGLAAILGAQLFSASHVVAIDHAERRLEAAKMFGADVTVNNETADPLKVVHSLTEDLGADVAIEAVGEPETFALAVSLTRPGARVANVGVHGRPAVLHLEQQWPRDLTITTGLVDTSSTAQLLGLLAHGQLVTRPLITHRFALGEFAAAYDTFERAADTGALKVVMTP